MRNNDDPFYDSYQEPLQGSTELVHDLDIEAKIGKLAQYNHTCQNTKEATSNSIKSPKSVRWAPAVICRSPPRVESQTEVEISQTKDDFEDCLRMVSSWRQDGRLKFQAFLDALKEIDDGEQTPRPEIKREGLLKTGGPTGRSSMNESTFLDPASNQCTLESNSSMIKASGTKELMQLDSPSPTKKHSAQPIFGGSLAQMQDNQDRLFERMRLLQARPSQSTIDCPAAGVADPGRLVQSRGPINVLPRASKPNTTEGSVTPAFASNVCREPQDNVALIESSQSMEDMKILPESVHHESPRSSLKTMQSIEDFCELNKADGRATTSSRSSNKENQGYIEVLKNLGTGCSLPPTLRSNVEENSDVLREVHKNTGLPPTLIPAHGQRRSRLNPRAAPFCASTSKSCSFAMKIKIDETKSPIIYAPECQPYRPSNLTTDNFKYSVNPVQVTMRNQEVEYRRQHHFQLWNGPTLHPTASSQPVSNQRDVQFTSEDHIQTSKSKDPLQHNLQNPIPCLPSAQHTDNHDKEIDKIIEQYSKRVRAMVNTVVPPRPLKMRDSAWRELARLTLQPPGTSGSVNTAASLDQVKQQDPFQKAIKRLNRTAINVCSYGIQKSSDLASARSNAEPPGTKSPKDKFLDRHRKVMIQAPNSAAPIIPQALDHRPSEAKTAIQDQIRTNTSQAIQLPTFATWLEETPSPAMYTHTPNIASDPYFRDEVQWGYPVPPDYWGETGPCKEICERVAVPPQFPWANNRIDPMTAFLAKYPLTGVVRATTAGSSKLQQTQGEISASFDLGHAVCKPVQAPTSRMLRRHPRLKARHKSAQSAPKDHNRAHAAAIQQRVEFLLFQKKEKVAFETMIAMC